MANVDESMLKRLTEQQGLKWDKFESFLLKWTQALEPYNTPLNFVDEVVFKEVPLEFNGQEYPFMTKEGGQHYLRRDLMKKSIVPVPNEFNAQEYGLRLNPEDCYLCKDVVRILNEKKNSIKGSTIDEIAGYIILPNKYPESIGNSIIVPVNHDDMSTRVSPSRGAIITPFFLDAVIVACEKHKLAAHRYHVMDDMSIPEHDHFHLFVEDNPMFSLVNSLLEDKTNTLTKGVFSLKNTPFDTLAITADASPDFSKYASHVLENMERDNQVFLLYYHDDTLLISPRKNLQENRKLHLKGADTHIHLIRPADSQNLDNIRNHVAMKGEYDWRKYL